MRILIDFDLIGGYHFRDNTNLIPCTISEVNYGMF
nr:MAG TPA: hypothetical protein [Bacteriophage sp.]